MNRIGIYISQDMIDAGVRISGQQCPLALGLKAAFNGEAGISRWSGYFTFGTQRFKLILNSDAIAFIKAFDAEQPVKPGVYHVDIWQESTFHEDLSSPVLTIDDHKERANFYAGGSDVVRSYHQDPQFHGDHPSDHPSQ